MGRPIIQSIQMWIGLAMSLLAIALASASLLTRDRNAWNTSGTPWPQYGAVHAGHVALFSTLWRAEGSGTHAWQSKDWMYDVIVRPISGWAIDYRRVGNSYGGTPPYTTIMHAVFVPIWYFAFPFAIGSGLLIRRAWSEAAIGRCAGCGYSLDGLPRGTTCPECGRETGATPYRS